MPKVDDPPMTVMVWHAAHRGVADRQFEREALQMLRVARVTMKGCGRRPKT